MSPLADRFAAVGADRSLAATWFASTLRDGFALGVHGTAAPFADVARAVLLGLFAHVPALTVDADTAATSILEGFGELDVHPDVAPGIEALAAAGHRMVTLSNGAASVAEKLLARAGLTGSVELTLSVEDAGVWKPHPAPYRYAAQRCGQAPGDLVMVAVHPWDLDGAHRAGLKTAYLDRRAELGNRAAPWPAIFAEPDHRIGVLADLVPKLEADQSG